MTIDDIRIYEVLSLDKKLISFDLETTGINPKQDRIVQMGAVVVTPEGDVSEGEEYVNSGVEIPASATDVHGVTNENTKNGTSEETILQRTAEAFEHSYICGYNVRFDLGFMREGCARYGIDFQHEHVIDPYPLFRRLYPHTLSAAVLNFFTQRHVPIEIENVDLSKAHGALWDARASLLVLEALLRLHKDIPRDVPQLHKYIFDNAPPGFLDTEKRLKWVNGQPCINFGKWSGTPLKEVPATYLHWMLRSNFPDDTKRWLEKHLRGEELHASPKDTSNP